MWIKAAGKLTLAITAAALCGFSAITAANAATITWDFLSPSGTVASPHVYTVGAYSITASAYTSVADNPWVAEALYGKTGGGLENGLGIASDPSLDNEIYGAHFIQLDVSSAIAGGLSNFSFQMGSATQNEGWTVYGSNSSGFGSVLTQLATGTSEGVSVSLASGYDYYDFFYNATYGGTGGENVLLHQFAGTTTPLPAALPLFTSGTGLLGFLGWRRKKRKAVAAA